MKDIGIRDALFNKFLTLNTFSGISFITFDVSGEPTNVSLPNKQFTVPSDFNWFELSFLPNEPEAIGMYNNGNERYTGFLQIDICTAKGFGEVEADNKFEWISRLFSVGSSVGDAVIDKVSKANTSEEANCYRTIIRVYFTADVDNNV